MAVHYNGLDISFLAAEDLSSYQYRFVHQASDTTVDLMDGATEYPIGILQNAPESGQEAIVRLDGTSKLVVNGAMPIGTRVKAEYVGAADNGKGDIADTEEDNMRAIVIKAAGAEDDVAGVMLLVNTIAMAPTESPSASPSNSPSASPSASPSNSPSESPSESPSLSPSASESPSESPSASPST